MFERRGEFILSGSEAYEVTHISVAPEEAEEATITGVVFLILLSMGVAVTIVIGIFALRNSSLHF